MVQPVSQASKTVPGNGLAGQTRKNADAQKVSTEDQDAHKVKKDDAANQPRDVVNGRKSVPGSLPRNHAGAPEHASEGDLPAAQDASEDVERRANEILMQMEVKMQAVISCSPEDQ